MKSHIPTDDEIEAGRQRGLADGPNATAASYLPESDEIRLALDTGAVLIIPRAFIKELATATCDQLEQIEVLPGGDGISIRAIDFDFGVPNLVRSATGAVRWTKRAGSTKSPAKTASSRENGRKGGRPKKKQVA